MPSDEYSSFGKGALKLKGGGGKVKKQKKKKDKGSDLEKALSTREASGEPRDSDAGEKQLEKRTRSRSPVEADGDDEQGPARQKTEAERRFEEAKKKKVSGTCIFALSRSWLRLLTYISSSWRCQSQLPAGRNC
jgi:protein FAM32A